MLAKVKSRPELPKSSKPQAQPTSPPHQVEHEEGTVAQSVTGELKPEHGPNHFLKQILNPGSTSVMSDVTGELGEAFTPTLLL